MSSVATVAFIDGFFLGGRNSCDQARKFTTDDNAKQTFATGDVQTAKVLAVKAHESGRDCVLLRARRVA
jgi:hypothetical protein